jgi:hypothetical protein
MKRLFCGSVVFAATLVLASCSDDPTEAFRGTPARLVVEPSSIFMDHDDDAAVVVRVEDDQGDPLPAPDMEVTAVGSGITVERNPNFLGTTVGAPLESEQQFIVTSGPTLLPTSFTVAAAGFSVEVPVRVMPTDVTGTFSNPTPVQNEPVTLTLEGFAFLPDATITFGPNEALILANDGASLTFLPAPGAVGPGQLEGVAIDFLPTTPLTLPTQASITVPAATAVPGTDSPATAPSLPVPAAGGVTGFFDAPDFVATIDHFYKLTVTEAGTYTVTVDWDIGTDIDLYFCEDPPAADFSNCPATSFTGHPEEVEIDLVPGTYFVVAEDFGEDAAGATLDIQVQREAAAALRSTPRASAPTVRR